MTARKPGRSVKLDLDEHGRGKVQIDGQDVSGLVRGVKLQGDVNTPPVVLLELARVTVFAETGASVEVDKPTRDFLLTLGWTPPEA